MISGGTSVSMDNKELNQLDSVDSDVNKINSTLPLGFSVDLRNTRQRTPLMNAALNGNFQTTKSLIQK